MKQCPKCATTASSDMRFCSVCGSPLRDATVPAASAPPSSGGPARSEPSVRPSTKTHSRATATPGGTAPPQQPAFVAQQPAYRPAPRYTSPGFVQGQRGVGVPGTNGLAIAALIVSLVGAGWLAVIFGHIARWQCRTRPQRGSGIALAALILGYIALPFNILFFIAIVSSGN